MTSNFKTPSSEYSTRSARKRGREKLMKIGLLREKVAFKPSIENTVRQTERGIKMRV